MRYTIALARPSDLAGLPTIELAAFLYQSPGTPADSPPLAPRLWSSAAIGARSASAPRPRR